MQHHLVLRSFPSINYTLYSHKHVTDTPADPAETNQYIRNIISISTLCFNLHLIPFHWKTTLLWLFKVAGEKKGKKCLRPYVKCPIFLTDFKSMEYLHRFLYVPPPSSTKFHRNLSSGSCAVHADRGRINRLIKFHLKR
jgi:hypothetical protein